MPEARGLALTPDLVDRAYRNYFLAKGNRREEVAAPIDNAYKQALTAQALRPDVGRKQVIQSGGRNLLLDVSTGTMQDLGPADATSEASLQLHAAPNEADGGKPWLFSFNNKTGEMKPVRPAGTPQDEEHMKDNAARDIGLAVRTLASQIGMKYSNGPVFDSYGNFLHFSQNDPAAYAEYNQLLSGFIESNIPKNPYFANYKGLLTNPAAVAQPTPQANPAEAAPAPTPVPMETPVPVAGPAPTLPPTPTATPSAGEPPTPPPTQSVREEGIRAEFHAAKTNAEKQRLLSILKAKGYISLFDELKKELK